MHGTIATIRHFKDCFPQMKWTTVNDWKKAMVVATKKAAKSGKAVQIYTLEEKKRGSPSILSEDVTSDIKRYITSLHNAGGVVNTRIVLAAATGILQQKDPSILYSYIKGVDKGGARGLKPPHFLRFILSNNIAVHCILRENICIYALNNIPAPPTITNLSTPLCLPLT